MIRDGFDNVFAAGLCTAGDGHVWDLLRVIPSAILTGQAAGAAVSLALDQKCSITSVEISKLQDNLENENMMIHFDDSLIPDLIEYIINSPLMDPMRGESIKTEKQ